MTRKPDPADPARPAAATVVFTAVVALTLLAPTGAGVHLSAGYEDTVGLEKSEPPADVSKETYERGTKTSAECAQPDASDPETALSDGFCGELLYNEGTPFVHASPPDQETNPNLDETVTIDVQMATYAGAYGTTTCSPFCDSEPTCQAVHLLAEPVTGTGPEQGCGDDHGHAYAGNVYAASPMQAYDAAGQSWLIPVTDTSFVAFVTQEGGTVIDDAALDRLVQGAKDEGDLVLDAQPEVCVFTPDANLGTHAPSSGRCEVTLDWMGPGSETEPCGSTAYVCGAAQPAWRGTTMCPMWHAACYISDAWNSAHHFAVWHGVVAPSPPDECPASEPGFDPRPGTFVAHDLDVYEPPTDETPAQGVPHYWDVAAQNVPGLGPLRDGRTPNVADTPAGQMVQSTPAFANHTQEPNEPDGWLGIHESSKTVTQDRLLDDCQKLASGEQDTDPWVNIFDTRVSRDVQGFGAPAGSEDPNRDPKPVMRVNGHVGLFADTDDDGDYEQAPASVKLEETREFGAYPILWDHHEPGEGCSFRGDTTIGDLTHQAGYADPTGLAVTLRLTDGALVDRAAGDTIPIVGPTAVVLLSEGLDPTHDEVDRVLDRADDLVGEPGDRHREIVRDAFQGQCGERTGGFTSTYNVVGEPLEGDGVAAAAIVTLEDRAGSSSTPGGGPVPDSPIDLGTGTHVWWDVDPFDADTLG